MLTYEASGPDLAGDYIVTYLTPGCAVKTVAATASTLYGAQAEAERLNAEARAKECAIAANAVMQGCVQASTSKP